MRQRSNHVLVAPVFVAVACALIPCSALAGVTFTLSNTSVIPGVGTKIVQLFYPQLAAQDPSAGSNLETLMNQAIAQEQQPFEDSVNQSLTALQDTSEFLGAMANAGAAAGKVMPVDYGTDPTLFSLSVAAGAAEHGLTLSDISNFNIDPTKPLPNQGVGATVSALLGINLRAFDPPRWAYFDLSRLSLFVNFFSINLNQPDSSSFDLDFKTFGVHGKYQLFDSHALGTGGLLRWGGLAVSTGFDYSNLTVLYNTTLQSTTMSTQTAAIDQQGDTLPINLTYSGAAKLGADIHIFSIPIEVMTHVQLLYFLSVYVGGGFDLNFGTATLAANASAPVTINAVNPNANESPTEIEIADPEATLSATGSSGVTVGDFRGYAGVQLNLYALAIFAQVSADTSNTIAANAGLRIFW